MVGPFSCIFSVTWLAGDFKEPTHLFVFELQALKGKIKGVFSMSYCCYGSLLCDENNTNVFTV